jgi:hypothetical protein
VVLAARIPGLEAPVWVGVGDVVVGHLDVEADRKGLPALKGDGLDERVRHRVSLYSGEDLGIPA